MRPCVALFVLVAGCGESSSSECQTTADCETPGTHCVDGQCAFECQRDNDCGDPDLRCDDRGRCIPIDAGDSDSDVDVDVDVDADSDTDTNLDPRFIPFGIGYSTPHPYSNDFNSDYTVIPPGSAQQIALFVTGFETESCCDILTIYDSAGGNQLDTYSGYLGDFTAGPYFASQLYLSYDTDFSVTNNGFDIFQGAYLPR